MPEISASPVAFQEAIDFLERKVRLPSKRSDDLQGAIHAKAFTVAGATKAQLLLDLHQAVTEASKQGQSIGEFIRNFDATAERHGWNYKGHRRWRAQIIYDTNMRTAHMAGHWSKIQQTKATRPYLQYVTAGDSRVRPEHQKWDRTVLEVDDPWWATHYPPNGWGCRCMVRTLSQSQMEREGLVVSKPPEIKLSERVNTRTGEIYGEVPEGIDTGWDYNVGMAWLGPEQALGQSIAQLPPRVRAAALGALQGQSEMVAAPFAVWAKSVLQQETAGAAFPVGYLSEPAFQHLVDQDITPSTATVTVFDFQLRRMLREVARRAGKATLPEEVLLTLPERLARPRAILWDKRKRNLVYVTDAPSTRSGRLVVSVEWTRSGQPFNVVISGGLVDRAQLLDRSNYDVIEGDP